MHAADIGPVPASERTQSPVDLFLIFAGANIVATTLQVGASLAPAFSVPTALALVGLGVMLGSALVASLVPLGPRLGVPSVIAARAAMGTRGAMLVAGLLYLTNFAWIAVNNVIAASACSRVAGGPESARWWALGLALTATAIVAGGPRLVGRADRVAVPMLLAVGALMTAAVLRLPAAGPPVSPGSIDWPSGLDIVIAYQVSWILMFADYSRYTASARKATLAVFLGLALTSLWFMPLGLLAARAAGSQDPGAMLAAVGLGASGAVLMTLATLTTNFVNIYLSSLAWKSIRPNSGEQRAIWMTGGIGAALSLLSSVWLDRFAGFMLVLGGLLVPVGGILLARFFLVRDRVSVADLYRSDGPCGRTAGFSVPALVAWAAGAVAFALAGSTGGTLPALATSVGVYWIGYRLAGGRREAGRKGAT